MEFAISQYIRRWVYSCVPDVIFEEDSAGNIYITRGVSETYPCVVAHLDQVQDEYPEDYKVVETPDIIFGYSPSNRKRCGLGADDKCGVWIALKMLKKHRIIKVALFPGEEVGCVGSSQANMTFFDNVRFVIEPDRRGASDLITTIGYTELCSDEFIEATNYADFGYDEMNGMMTDVQTLKHNGLKVSCINMSCGYYDPHTEDEYVVKKDMINAMKFVDNIISNCTSVYSHELKVQDYSKSTANRKSYNSQWWDRRYLSNTSASKRSRSKSRSSYYTSDANGRERYGDYYGYSDYIDDADDDYVEQYSTMVEYVRDTLEYAPDMDANYFLQLYGEYFDTITKEEIQAAIDSMK